MQLTISRDKLLTPLQWVNTVIQKNQTMPILSHVMLDAQGDELNMTGTDTEVQVKSKINMEEGVHQTGSITVPARKLLDICRSMPEKATLDLQYIKNLVYVRSGNSRFSLVTKPSEDFPHFARDQQVLTINLAQNKLLQLLRRTHFAMAAEDVRPYLNGLLLELEGQTLRAVATDGHRLAYDCLELDEALTTDSVRVIVPYKAVMELLKVLNADDSTIALHISDSSICFISDRIEFTSRLIDARYPNYNRVIPAASEYGLALDRMAFKNALNRASILCPEKSRIVQLQLRNNLLRVYAYNTSDEEAEELMNVTYQGPDIDIGFNVNYLFDVLNVINNDTVNIYVADNHNAVLIEDPESTNSIFVVMAMQV